MNEVAELLRELILEIQGLRQDVQELRGPLGHDLGDIHAELTQLPTALGGVAGYTIGDVVDRLGSTSIFGLDDLHTELVNIGSSIDNLAG